MLLRRHKHRMTSILACIALLCACWSPAGFQAVAYSQVIEEDQQSGGDESSSVLLDSLTISAGELTPAFDPDTTSYEILLPYGVQSLSVTPVPQDEASGVQLRYGEPNQEQFFPYDGQPIVLQLAQGDSSFSITVFSNNGAYFRTYTFSIKRPALDIYVNIADDTIDVNPGDGLCADANGACSLRAAIMEANATSAHDTIYLQDKHYRLSISSGGPFLPEVGDLDVFMPLTIIGTGAESTIIDACEAYDRVFRVMTHEFHLSGVSIIGAMASSEGGGIRFDGVSGLSSAEHNFTVTDVALLNNMAAVHGGAIELVNGHLTLNHVVISGSMAENSSGTVYISPAAVLHAENVVFEENGASSGAAVYNAGEAKFIQSEFRNNKAWGIGVIYNVGTMEIISSVIDSNTAYFQGVIYNEGTLLVTDSQIENNSAEHEGVIYNLGDLAISESLFHENQARIGSAIYNTEDHSVILNQVVFENNTADSFGAFYNAGVAEINDSEFAGNISEYGGAIYNKGVMAISESEFEGNRAIKGGAIQNNGLLDMMDSRFMNNIAGSGEGNIYGAEGGAIINHDVLTLTRVEMGYNISDDKGGAIWSNSKLQITDSYIHHNSAVDGGGLYVIQNFNLPEIVKISGTTFSDNLASTNGGGAYLEQAAVIMNSTFTGNQAGASGGGLNFESKFLVLSHATIADNLLTGAGSGEGGQGGQGGQGQGGQGGATIGGSELSLSMFLDGKIVVANSIIGGSASVDETIRSNMCDGTVTLLGMNIIRGSLCGIGEDHEFLLDVDPMLAPLEMNGGLTLTRALLPGSPAIDAGSVISSYDLEALDPSGSLELAWFNLDADQRGESRIESGWAPDIGAYEFPYEYLSMVAYYDPLREQLQIRYGAKLNTNEDLAPLAAEHFQVSAGGGNMNPQWRLVEIEGIRYGDDDYSIVLDLSDVEEDETLLIRIENNAVKFANDQTGERRHAFQREESVATPQMIKDQLMGDDERPIHIGDVYRAVVDGSVSALGDFHADPVIVRYLLSLIRPQYVSVD